MDEIPSMEIILNNLKSEKNFRKIPEDVSGLNLLDFSTNDYLGFAARKDFRAEFLTLLNNRSLPSFSSSSSRLLASAQENYYSLENLLSKLYGREVLLFNSGYHANVGILQALGTIPNLLIVADKLVHASIIDGIILSKAPFKRFPHNDYETLERILNKEKGKYQRIVVVTESIFSMDGDTADLGKLLELKRLYPEILLYIDEAHAIGTVGPQGLGLTMKSNSPESYDIIVGTFGKAFASYGAYAAVSELIKNYLVNKSRSFIFSTSLPPFQVKWTEFILKKVLEADKERIHLKRLNRELSELLYRFTGFLSESPSHIQPLIVGSSEKALTLSSKLREHGIKCMAIRRPTVLTGTERLRFSINAGMTSENIKKLADILEAVYEK